MKNKKSHSKNDYKSIAYQINNGKNKSQININKNIKEENPINKNGKATNIDKKFDKSAFVMVPINHPKINEIIKLLNESEEYKKINEKEEYQQKFENSFESKVDSNSENNFKLIITLNDILTNINKNKIIIPENSIITPLAKDYIKQKKIEAIYTKN